MIGANREAVTRAFGLLQDGGALQVRRRLIYVEDVKALREQPGASWRKDEERIPPRRLSASRRTFAPGVFTLLSTSRSLYARSLAVVAVSPFEVVGAPRSVHPVFAACFPRPKVYVKEHLVPARYLPLPARPQVRLPLAQKEAIDFLPGGFGAPR